MSTSIAFSPTRESERRFFVGRKSELAKIQEVINQQALCVLAPAKGIFCPIGKTALAREWASRYGNSLWLNGRNKESLAQELQKIQSVVQQQGTLLVVDGVKDPAVAQEILPRQYPILLTSRFPLQDNGVVEVGPLLLAEAIEFLHGYTGTQDSESAIQIAEALDCLPTSLEKAAELIVEHQASLKNYFSLQESLLEENAKRLKKIGNLPERNKSFTGREIALANLEDALKTGSCVVVTGKRKLAAKTGLGGMGKTQIALQYAYRNAEKYPNRVFWINSETEATLFLSYTSLAKELGVFLTEKEQKEKEALYNRVNRALEQLGGYLLIYDNADDQALLTGRLPQSGGHILITSRSCQWDLDKMRVFEVGVFKRKESIALIQKMTLLTKEEADRIADKVKDLPLAIAQAAAYIRQVKISADEYIKRFEEKSQELLSSYQQPTDEFSKTVHITWRVSMDKIKEREKEYEEKLKAPDSIASSLMNLCSFFDSRDIPQGLLLEWMKRAYQRNEASLGDLVRTLSLLKDFSMIEWEERGVSIHPIVQLVTRNALTEAEVHSTYNQGVVVLAVQLQEFRRDKVDTWDQLKASLPHALAVFAREDLMEKVDLRKQYAFKYPLGVASQTLGQNAYQVLSISESCVKAAEKWNAESSDSQESRSALGSSLNAMGFALTAAGKTNEGLTYYQKAFELRRSLLGEKHSDIAISLNNIGTTLHELERLDEALIYLRQALEMWQSLFGEEDPHVAKCLNNLANLLEAQEKLDEALAYYRQALKIQESLFGQKHPDIAASLNNIGGLLSTRGAKDEALSYYHQALKIWQGLFGEKHPDVAACLNNIGSIFNALGQQEEALIHYHKALEIWEAFFGERHPEVATSLNNIGLALADLGKNEEALTYHHRALELWRKLYGEKHSNVATSLNNIGLVLDALEDRDQALTYYYQALEIQQDAFGKQNVGVAMTLNNIGSALCSLNKEEEGLTYHQEALKIRRALLGEKHPDVAMSLNNIGGALHFLDKVDKALMYYRQAFEIWKDFFGEKHPSVAMSLNNIGGALFTLQQEEEALTYFYRALEIQKALLGEQHPDVVQSLNNIGGVLALLGKEDEAAIYFKQALKIQQNL